MTIINANSESTQDLIKKIFEQLKKDSLIEKDRILKPKEKLNGFGSRLFPKRIYFDPEINDLSENTIKICLLHEEGHILEGHCGVVLSHLITLIGGGLIIFDVVWILIYVFFSEFIVYNLEIWVQLLIVGTFLVIFSVRLASYPLLIDECVSDRWASEKIRDCYQIEKPSVILYRALEELERNYQKITPTKNQKKGYLYCIKKSLTEYHPTVQQRVENIVFRVDKK